MKKINYRKLRNELLKRTERYAEGVRLLYEQALADIAKEFVAVNYDPNKVFSFESCGKFTRIDAIMSSLERQIQRVVEKSIAMEFGEAYKGCNELIEQVLGDRINTVILNAFMPKVTSGNAAKAFIIANKSGNIIASQRVWNGAVLGQMETAVEEALIDGMPAKRMAKLIEQFLNNPDDCFRRFRIKTGVDASGKSMYGRKWKKRITHQDGSTTWKDADPRNYPTGQGVYHSSYKNALRYTRSTTNIAYRTADYDRYQELSFVIGIEIHTTNNPNHKEDICDYLAGTYPKEFKWTGWHPNCMCYQIPLLASVAEVNKMADEVMRGGDPNDIQCRNEVTELPPNFVSWLNKNKSRYRSAEINGTIPFFLRDNTRFVTTGLNNSLSTDKIKTMRIVDLSETERKTIIKNIRELRKSAHLFSDVDIHITIEQLPEGRMLTYNNGLLQITNLEYELVDGRVFGPAKSLQSAFRKLKNKEQLDFNEEYAIEALFHGSIHSRMKPKVFSIIDGNINEICTQLYARENYSSILSVFGVEAVNQDEIKINGYGYNGGCNLLRRFFTTEKNLDSQLIMNLLMSDDIFNEFMAILSKFNLSQREKINLLKQLI